MRTHLKLVKVYVKGKRTRLDLGKITFGRVVSSNTYEGVDDLQLILVETATRQSLDEIAVGRVVLGRLPWVELSLDEIAMGRVVLSELINFQREDNQYL